MSAPAVRPTSGVWERESGELVVPPARGCPLPMRLRNRGKALLNQEFWLWGQDVRRADNLLHRFGFAHLRPPRGVTGSHRYILPDGALALWGFGLLATWPDAPPIFLGRFRFEPRFPTPDMDPRHVWQPRDVGPLASPQGRQGWDDALYATVTTARWIAAYEAWVAEYAEPDYRQSCLARWPRAACRARAIAAAWRAVADDCERCFNQSQSHSA